MLSIPLGPFSLPFAPLLLMVCIGLASWLAARLAGVAHAQDAGNAVFGAAVAGLLAARLVHLLLHADLYAAAPLSAFDVRDGGWQGTSGMLAGALWLVWRGWHLPALRRPLASSLLAGVVLWTAGTVLTRTVGRDELPSITLIELDGGAEVGLPQVARGRPVVVNLWATWCGSCRREMPVLADAQARQSAIGFLFVNQGESAAAVQSYLRTEKLALREVLLDGGSSLGPAVGSRGLPTTLFYDAQGRLVDAHVGALNAAALEGRLRRLRL